MISLTATNFIIIKMKILYLPDPPKGAGVAAAGVVDAGCPKLKAGVLPKVDIFGVEL
jgi:hypothetical protein